MQRADLFRQHRSEPDSERRITNVIIEHWQAAKGKKSIASETDLDPNALDGILDSCFLINAQDMEFAGQHKYIYIGRNILDAYGNSVTATKDSECIDPLAHQASLNEVLKTKKPVTSEGEFTNKDGLIVKYRQCLVPLGKDGQNIDAIFGGMRFKVFGKSSA